MSDASAPRLSLVVPVGPGDGAWRGLLPLLLPLPAAVELLLVGAAGDPQWQQADGCRPPRLRRLQARAGRARQQNAGASEAAGALLWFLHCDSRPDARAREAAFALDPAFDALGWFPLAFHDGGALHRLNALGATLRSGAGLPFGDQGLLLPAARFHALGGFDPTLPRGEDLDLVIRARAAGLRLQRLPGRVATSARRYRAAGWWPTTLAHLRWTVRLARDARRRVRGAP